MNDSSEQRPSCADGVFDAGSAGRILRNARAPRHRNARPTPLRRRFRSAPAVGVLVTLAFISTQMQAQWEPVQSGFEVRQFLEPGPVEAFVVRLDRSDPQNRAVDSCIAQGQLYKEGLPNGGREIPSAMAARYNDAINFYWQTWGQRNDVIAAINGDYWEREYYPGGPYTGRPASGQVLSGWFARRFSEWGGGSGFFWTIWGVPHIGGDVVNGGGAARQFIEFADATTANFTGVNVERDADDLILYTPQWAASTHTDDTGVEALIEVSRPNLPLPQSVSAYSCTGTVLDVRDGAGNTPIQFDHVVASGTGSAAGVLRSRCAVGQTVRIKMAIRDYGLTSRTPPLPPQDWTKAYGSVGVDREVVVDGQVTSNLPSPDTTRDPRTAVAFNDSHAFFIVVDGRRVGSIGMTFGELGAFCVNALGATHAASLDGGGSSALWVKGRGIVNRPSDGAQRATCNGLLMVSVLPREQSVAFATGEPVRTTGTAPIRVGPGTNYAVAANLPGASEGVIEDHTLNGVLAKGESWWKWTSGGITGWTQESLIETVPAPGRDSYTLR